MENKQDDVKMEVQDPAATSTVEDEPAEGEDRVKKLEEQVKNLNTALSNERKGRKRIVEEPKNTQETANQDDDSYLGDVDKRIEAKLSAKEADQRKKALASAVEEFCNDYPEYLPENDVNDANWNKLNEKLKRFNPGDTKDEIKDSLIYLHRGLQKPQIQQQELKTQVEDSGVGSGSGRIKNDTVRPSALTRALNQYELDAMHVGMSSNIYKDEQDYRQKLADAEAKRKTR